MTKIRSKQQLVEAAAKVFEEKGYGATRIEDVAAELGVLQGSLYYHVDSKAALYRLVVKHHLRKLIATLTEVADSSADPEEKLRMAILNHLVHVERHLLEAPEWFSDPTRSPIADSEIDEHRQLILCYREGWAAIVEEGIACGKIAAGTDAIAVALSLISMCDYVSYWYKRDGAKSIDEIAEMQHQLVWSGMAMPGSG